MSPPNKSKSKKGANKRPTSSPNPPKVPTRHPSIKLEMDLCTSRHAGCIGVHHQHSHSSDLTAANAGIVQSKSSSGKPKGENSNIHKVSFSSSTKNGHKTSSIPVSSKSGQGKGKADLHNSSKTILQPGSPSSKRHPHGFTTQVIPAADSKIRKVSGCSVDTKACPASPQLKNNNYSTNSSASSFQQCSRSIICCSDVSIKEMMNTVKSPINILKEKTLKRVFHYLNPSDLLNCRLVQKHWNNLISHDQHFLNNTVFVINIQKSYEVETDTVEYNDLSQYANLPFLHARFQYIDYHYLKEPEYFAFHNSDNEKYFPKSGFLKALSSLEISNSYLLWSTLKRILAKTVLLDKLILSNCLISEKANTTLNEFDDFTAGVTAFGLKALEIYETRGLDNITRVLTKVIGYSNQSLTSLKIRYYPPASRAELLKVSKTDSYNFCRDLKALITLCASSLEVLVLDIQHEPSLNLLGYHLSKELEALSYRLSLKEFALSPAMGVWLDKPNEIPMQNVTMTMKNAGDDARKMLRSTTISLGRFLETQKNLKKLALPCIEYPEAFSGCFRSVLQRMPCAANLQYLAVPSAGFLPEDFLHQFPKLKGVKVGSSCCGDCTSVWEAFRHYNSEQHHNISPRCSEEKLVQIIERNQPVLNSLNLTSEALTAEYFEMMKNIEELHVSSFEPPEKFSLLAKGLCNLTCLEVSSGLDTPILRDADLQACVKYLKKLESLVIGCSQNFTDFGITGIPERYCQLMFKHQKYHSENVVPNVWKAEKVRGRPLSDLKGLKKLVLMGSSGFTDIGITYGLSFKELKYCHLPYSHNITAWGIARLGEMNPSIESLVLSGVSQLTKDAFLELRKTHERLKKGDSSRSSHFREVHSPFSDNIALILPSPRELARDIYNYCTRNLFAMCAALRGGQSLVHEVEIRTS